VYDTIFINNSDKNVTVNNFLKYLFAQDNMEKNMLECQMDLTCRYTRSKVAKLPPVYQLSSQWRLDNFITNCNVENNNPFTMLPTIRISSVDNFFFFLNFYPRFTQSSFAVSLPPGLLRIDLFHSIIISIYYDKNKSQWNYTEKSLLVSWTAFQFLICVLWTIWFWTWLPCILLQYSIK